MFGTWQNNLCEAVYYFFCILLLDNTSMLARLSIYSVMGVGVSYYKPITNMFFYFNFIEAIIVWMENTET